MFPYACLLQFFISFHLIFLVVGHCKVPNFLKTFRPQENSGVKDEPKT